MIVDFLGDISLAYANIDNKEQELIALSINQQLGESDFRIANLESPMLISDTHKEALKEEEGEGAHLCMHAETQSVFFDLLDVDAYGLANNHIFDYGESGLRDTLEWLEQNEKKHVGASMMANSPYAPLIVEQVDARIAIFSICENEFGIASERKAGAAGVNYRLVSEAIDDWRGKVDIIIIIYHGGNEHYPFPSPRQKDLFHRLADAGADVVIGMHSHCPVGKEIYKGKELYYGLGNFYFPKKTYSLYLNDNYGYIVRMTIENRRIVSSKILSYYCDDTGGIWKMQQSNSAIFDKYFAEISDVIANDNRLIELFQSWSMYYGKMLYQQLIENAKSEKEVYSQNIIKNLFSCESHNELITEFLNTRYYFSDRIFDDSQDYIKHIIGMKDKSSDSCDEVVWGCTEKSYIFVNNEKKKGKKLWVIDSDVYKQGLYFAGLKVRPPKEIPDVDIYIGTSEKSFTKIQKELINLGISKNRIKWIDSFVCANEVII